MPARAAGAALGAVFGAVLCWSGMADPDVIRDALLFRESYLFLFMASAVGTAAIGVHLLERSRRRAVLVDVPIKVERLPIERRHIVGSVIFGTGWGLANVCPGPVVAQIGLGSAWALVTFAGILGGVKLYLVREQRETEPATERTDAPEAVAAVSRATAPAAS